MLSPPVLIFYGLKNNVNQAQASLSMPLHQKPGRSNGGGSSSSMGNMINITGAPCSGAVQKTLLTHAFNHIQLSEKIVAHFFCWNQMDYSPVRNFDGIQN